LKDVIEKRVSPDQTTLTDHGSEIDYTFNLRDDAKPGMSQMTKNDDGEETKAEATD
jgi:hypothetical protein